MGLCGCGSNYVLVCLCFCCFCAFLCGSTTATVWGVEGVGGGVFDICCVCFLLLFCVLCGNTACYLFVLLNVFLMFSVLILFFMLCFCFCFFFLFMFCPVRLQQRCRLQGGSL